MIGAGGHASQSIYPSLRFTDLELVAVADLDEDRARDVGTRFGNPRIYTDLEKMLQAEELDAVGVVGPPELHYEGGRAVVESGRHLFVEKPPAPDLARTRQLEKLAAERGLQVMVGFMKRHASAYVRAMAISQRPEFGKRTILRLNYSHYHLPLRDHLVFMSTHPLDLARYLMGDVASGTVFKRGIGDHFVVALLLQHVDGGASQITLSAHEPRVQESVELVGESALVEVRNVTELRYHPAAPDMRAVMSTDETMTSLWFPEFTLPIGSHDNHVLQGYAGELNHFAESIKTGSRVSPGIADGVEAMRLAEAIYSAPEGLSELRLPD
ncbi:Gfo/Idh/MocA family protein [Jiangella gansuensis]|uniref:Gfo/Idh/MocA family protein n=1 Tax=Jiangella gansuensis TaxID=281473 RepID=UPI00047D4938|nr:Gfo/Idh/MocA family oxidoreductase [Jiangella gansuensis]